jgi:hypothetical protein
MVAMESQRAQRTPGPGEQQHRECGDEHNVCAGDDDEVRGVRSIEVIAEFGGEGGPLAEEDALRERCLRLGEGEREAAGEIAAKIADGLGDNVGVVVADDGDFGEVHDAVNAALGEVVRVVEAEVGGRPFDGALELEDVAGFVSGVETGADLDAARDGLPLACALHFADGDGEAL